MEKPRSTGQMVTGDQYAEKHISEMGDEIDTAFHRDLIRLFKKYGVETDSLSMNTVGILEALDKLISYPKD